MDKMLQKYLNFYRVAVIVVVLLSGCNACFRYNQEGKTILSTGSTYYKECQCTEPGYTVKNLQWLGIDDRPIEFGPGTDEDVYIERQHDGINLFIRKFSKTMSGTYKCVTQVEGVKYVQAYSIEAYEPLYFYGTPNDQFLTVDKDSVIFCRARGEFQPLIRWQRKDNTKDDAFIEIYNDEKYEITQDGLLVKSVTLLDAGIYKCTAQGITTGEELDKFIKVEVMTIPTITELKATPGQTVPVGTLLSIDCIAEGTPSPQYIWKKNETEPSNNTKTWKQTVNTMTIENVKDDHRGTYICIAYNAAGNVSLDIFVEVLTPPDIFYFPNITQREGEVVPIVCNATGRSEPNITIIFAGTELDNVYDESIDSVLPNESLLYLRRSSEGFYVCNASNEVDFQTASMYLTVIHPPHFEEENETIWGWDGKTVNLSCDQDSNPEANVTWRFESNELTTDEKVELNKMLLELLNTSPENYISITLNENASYGIYYCNARNDLGEATKKITLKKGFRPNGVEAVTILNVTATSVTFYINAADFEGPELLGYISQYDIADNYNITDIHINRTWAVGRPYKLDKLKPYTKYYASFAAINEVGEGGWSEKLEFVTLERSAPDMPILESESISFSSGSNNLVLNWEAPEDNGDPIDYYTIRYCPVEESEPLQIEEKEQNEDSEGAPCKMEKVMSSTKVELKNLQENTTYFLELVAHNAKGNSNAVNISVTVSAQENIESASTLSGGTIIGLSVVIVIVCLLLFDLLLLVWRRQGIMASLCLKNKKTTTEIASNSRDKKGLLNREPTIDDNQHNGHKQFEYNKSTGTVTGKHSSV